MNLCLLKNKIDPADLLDRTGAEILLEGLQHLFWQLSACGLTRSS
jgi:hypothetical protein